MTKLSWPLRATFIAVTIILGVASLAYFLHEVTSLVEDFRARKPVLEVAIHDTLLIGFCLGAISFAVLGTLEGLGPLSDKAVGVGSFCLVASLVIMLAIPIIAYPTARLVMPQLGYTYCEHAGSPHFQRFRPLYFTTTAQACYEEWLRHRK